MPIFYAGSAGRGHDLQFDVLIAASAMRGWAPRWRRNGAYFAARFMNGHSCAMLTALLNMGILCRSVARTVIGGLLDTMWNWRACYLFVVLCAGVILQYGRWMRKRIRSTHRAPRLPSYKTLFGNSGFNCYC